MMLISRARDGCGFPSGLFIWLVWLLYQDLYLLEHAPCTTIMVPINLEHICSGSCHVPCLLKGLQRASEMRCFLRLWQISLSFAVFAGRLEVCRRPKKHSIKANPWANVVKSQIVFHDDSLSNGDLRKSKAASSSFCVLESLKPN